jgi:hypothetical protein
MEGEFEEVFGEECNLLFINLFINNMTQSGYNVASPAGSGLALEYLFGNTDHITRNPLW